MEHGAPRDAGYGSIPRSEAGTRRMARRRLAVIGVVAAAWIAAPVHADALLRATLDSLREAESAAIGGIPLLSGRLLGEFYAGREYAPAWVDSSRVKALLALAEHSPADGFVPEDFHAASLRRLGVPGVLQSLTGADRVGADIILSDALLRYVHHHRYGKVDPVAVDPEWNDRAAASSEVLLADMHWSLSGKDLSASLSNRFPRPFWYRGLRLALQRYTARPDLAGLPPLPAGANLGLGSDGPRVVMLRERLRLLEGDGAEPVPDPGVFDPELGASVAAFQRRAGLAADGIVGPATLAALNGSFDAGKAEQIRINLERMRWLYQDLPEQYVFVDIAGFRVQLVRGDAIAWSTRAIVGKPETQTPTFRDTIDHLVFNPTWTVPASIQKKIGRVGNDYRLVDRQTGRRVGSGDASDHRRYLLVQEPGPKNALGRVKFMFPNSHAIYLHDTPSRDLFSRRTRILSNGCVRVQNPLELAELLLGRAYWDQSAIRRVVTRGKTRYVHLTDTVPVLLYYLTAYADEAGTVSFRRDVYGRDAALRDALSAPVLRTRIVFPESRAPMPADAHPPTGPRETVPPVDGPARLTAKDPSGYPAGHHAHPMDGADRSVSVASPSAASAIDAL